MKRTMLALLAALALAAGGFFGWRAFGGGAPGDAGGSAGGASSASVGDSLRSLAKAAASFGAADDRAIRCKIGNREHFMRRLDCAQQHGLVLEGGGGAYAKLTKEEMQARSGAPKPAAKPADGQPPAAPAEGGGSRGSLQ